MVRRSRSVHQLFPALTGWAETKISLARPGQNLLSLSAGDTARRRWIRKVFRRHLLKLDRKHAQGFEPSAQGMRQGKDEQVARPPEGGCFPAGAGRGRSWGQTRHRPHKVNKSTGGSPESFLMFQGKRGQRGTPRGRISLNVLLEAERADVRCFPKNMADCYSDDSIYIVQIILEMQSIERM